MKGRGDAGDRSTKLFQLDSRVALVAGAANGLGRAIALGLADAGADRIVADVDHSGLTSLVTELAKDGYSALPVTVDVADPRQVTDMVTRVVEAHGRLDVLVHSAWIGGRHPAADYPRELWQRVLDGLANTPSALARTKRRAPGVPCMWSEGSAR